MRDIIRQLKHQHVVRFLKYGKSHEAFYFIFEWVEGENLATFLQKRGGPIPLEIAAPLLLGTLEGLAYAHNVKITLRTPKGQQKVFRGIVHRDLKPQNILLTRQGNNWIPKITDFGFSKGFEVAGFTNMRTPVGVLKTPMYWPREQITHYSYSDPATYVFSLAAIFYELLTGSWIREGFQELFDRCKQSETLPSLSDYLKA